MIHEVGAGQGNPNAIRILNKDGLIIYSTESRRRWGRRSTSAPKGCIGCHAQSAPPSKTRPARPDAAISPTSAASGCWRLMQEIENGPECSQRQFHVKEAGRSILGVIDTTLSLHATGRQSRSPLTAPNTDLVPGGRDPLRLWSGHPVYVRWWYTGR